MPTLEQCNTKLQLEICTRRAYFLMSNQTLLVIYNVVSLHLYTYIRRYKTIIPFEGNRERDTVLNIFADSVPVTIYSNTMLRSPRRIYARISDTKSI